MFILGGYHMSPAVLPGLTSRETHFNQFKIEISKFLVIQVSYCIVTIEYALDVPMVLTVFPRKIGRESYTQKGSGNRQ